jgi:hypothetical protein
MYSSWSTSSNFAEQRWAFDSRKTIRRLMMGKITGHTSSKLNITPAQHEACLLSRMSMHWLECLRLASSQCFEPECTACSHSYTLDGRDFFWACRCQAVQMPTKMFKKHALIIVCQTRELWELTGSRWTDPTQEGNKKPGKNYDKKLTQAGKVADFHPAHPLPPNWSELVQFLAPMCSSYLVSPQRKKSWKLVEQTEMILTHVPRISAPVWARAYRTMESPKKVPRSLKNWLNWIKETQWINDLCASGRRSCVTED